MRSQYKPRIIISTDRYNKTKGENSANYMQFRESLDMGGIKYHKSFGYFEGIHERSFLIDYTPRNFEVALGAMRFYEQDCILIIDNEGFGTLHYSEDKEPEIIGKINVSDKEPSGDHTYLPFTCEYITFT